MDNKPYLTASPKQGVDLLIVPVKSKADDYFIGATCKKCLTAGHWNCAHFDECGNHTPALKVSMGKKFVESIELPPGSYTFLFCSNNANEEQARGIVASQMERGAVFNPEVGHYQSAGWTTYYRNYEHYPATSICIPNTALESLQSLLRSLGLDPSSNFAILKIN